MDRLFKIIEVRPNMEPEKLASEMGLDIAMLLIKSYFENDFDQGAASLIITPMQGGDADV